MPFTSCGGCLKDIFITEAEIIDRYVGNQLWLSGANVDGQLGTGSTFPPDRSSPVQTVSTGTNWASASAGSTHSAAIKTDGTLWLWGSNNDGRLGNNNVVFRSSPVQTVSAGTNWKQVSLGGAFGAAIKTDGTLWLWGRNDEGRLGNNNRVPRSSPVQTISAGTNWKQVAAGCGHTAAVKTDGTLWVWGCNDFGQLGQNDLVLRSSPVQTISAGTNWKQVSVSGSNSGAMGAIKTDGTLWVWGNNDAGRLGTNDVIARSSPVQTVSGGTNWKKFSFGTSHAAAIKTDGSLWLWGNNTNGRLGNNSTNERSSPVQTVSGGTNWKEVNAGEGRTYAIKYDGTLWVWGDNTSGNLGDNSTTERSSPVQTVARGNYWKSVGQGAAADRLMAITFTES